MIDRAFSRDSAPRASALEPRRPAPPWLSPSHALDALVVSDPYLERLAIGLRASTASAVSAGAMALVAKQVHLPITIAIVAGVVGMLASTSVQDADVARQRVTMALVPLAASATLTLGSLVPSSGAVGSFVFLLVVFASVLARALGPRGTALGTVAFLTYLDAQFFGAGRAELPWMIAATFAGAAAAFVARFVLFRDRPEHAWRRALGAYRRSVAMLLAHMADAVVRSPRGREAVRRTARRVNEAALTLEEQLAARDRSPWADPARSDRLRARVLTAEVAVERAASEGRRLLDSRPLSASERDAIARAMLLVRQALRTTTRGDLGALRASIARADLGIAAIADGPLSAAMRDLTATTLRIARAEREASTEGATRTPPDDGANPRDVDARFYLRQAIQATLACGLAMVAGRWLSPARWYWAVIAAFVVFTRVTTRGELLVRAGHRVLGTVVGVVVGLLLAHVVHGHADTELVLVFVWIFFGMYMMRIAYAWMVLSISALLAILYDLLGRFSPGLLYLRIDETLCGALIGAAIAALVLPSRTAPKVWARAADLVRDLSAYLGGLAADVARDGATSGSAQRRARGLDEKLRALREASRPLVGRFVALDPALRDAVQRLAHLVFLARSLATASAPPDVTSEDAAALGRTALAVAARASEVAAQMNPARSQRRAKRPDAEHERPPATPGRAVAWLETLHRMDETLAEMSNPVPVRER